MSHTEEAVSLFTMLMKTGVDLYNRNMRSILLAYSSAHPYAGMERIQLPEQKLFNENYPDANAKDDFRFTVDELKRLALALDIPPVFKSQGRDR